MKVNRNLLQKLKEKNINLDLDRYSNKLRTQSNAPTQVSSSEVDSMDSSFMMQSINFTPAAAALNSNFRVRPMSAKREENADLMGQSQIGFSMTQSTFNRKDSKKTLANNSQYQHIIDQRLNQQSSQSSRSTVSSTQKIKASENQGKGTITTQNGNNIMMKTMTQSFYKDSANSGVKKDNGSSSIQKSKPPLPNNNDQNLMRQSSIKDRKGSVDVMTVSIYKDSQQNKIREDLLNYSGSEEQFSDFIQDEGEEDFNSENYSSQMLRPSSSQRKNSSKGRYEEEDDNSSGINSFNNRRGRSQDSKEDKLRKTQSLKTTSRNTSEEKKNSKQDLEDFLEQYDRMNNGEDDSQNSSFDEELMNQVQYEFISESITAELIEKITDVKQEDFDKIRRIAIRHDCEQDSLQMLGEMCPNIAELNINDSIANSLRDIGTSMRNLKVLWISRVRLQDLSGINAFPLLVELYASYNSIKNLNDLYFHENLEVLDLEGNDIQDNDQIEVIETMSKIKVLTLSQNPISKKDDYRQSIRSKIPQLQLLDDIPIDQNAPEQQSSRPLIRRRGFPTSAVAQKNVVEEEEDLYESLKKLNWNGEKFLSEDVVKQLDEELKKELPEEELLIYSVKKTVSKANKKLTVDENNATNAMKSSNIFGQTMNNFNSTTSNFRRPQTATTASSSRNGTYQTQNQSNPFAAKQTLPDSISSLVEGTDQAFYGNPLKALKHKRKNELVTTKKNESNDTEETTSMSIPKNIVNLLDQFKQETNDEGMNKLKEELKFFDFMVEQQMNIQKKKSVGNAFNQNINAEIPTELQKSKIIIKRPQIKLRTTSSQAQTKNLQSDQQFNIQQQFKDLQSKSRQPVKPTLMQNKLIENTSK